MKSKKKNLVKEFLIVACVLLILNIIGLIITNIIMVKNDDNDNQYQTEIEIFSIDAVSLETKTVNNIEYQILNLSYYDSDKETITNKSILVDLNTNSCLWNSKDGIKSIKNNQNCFSVYDNGISITKGNKNSIEIIRKFYTKDVELASLSIEITLTKENYEKIFSY